MPWIHCKVELQLKLKSIVFNTNSNNIIFTIKGAKLFVFVVTLSAKYNQKL